MSHPCREGGAINSSLPEIGFDGREFPGEAVGQARGLDGHHANALALSDEDGIHAGPGGAPMNSVLIGLAGLVAAMSPGPDVAAGEAQVPPPGLLQDAACEIRPDAPYINPRLPLGRAAYAQRPACNTT